VNIFITGGTGLIGRALLNSLRDEKSTVLTRDIANAKAHAIHNERYVTQLDEVDFNGIDVVINLAGEPIADKRWSEAQKQRICESRWKNTDNLVTAMLAADTPPQCFISGSAIGFYGRQNEIAITESFQRPYNEFTHEVCQTWENKALKAQSPKTRVCLLRTGIVLAKTGGALAKMLPAFKLGVGGPISNGQQYMSWIHIDDMVQIILSCIHNQALTGVLNATAPNPVTNNEFSSSLSRALSRPCFLRVPKFILTVLLGELADLLLYGQNVMPEKLQQHNFTFKYPVLASALDDLLVK
jgi:uncharacterized protein (TIGR01777 family)